MDASKTATNSNNHNANIQPTTVMGLGLGMGIQMGSDGRFYASMGGVTMPSSSHSAQPVTPQGGNS